MTVTVRSHKKAVPQQRRSSLVVSIIILSSFLLALAMVLNLSMYSAGSAPAANNAQASSGTTATEGSGSTPQPAAAGTEALMGEYTAVSNSESAERAENIRLAAEALNGVVVQPGESLSFNQVIGDPANDERYKVAPLSPGSAEAVKGGGASQVSTALYVAALIADLTVVERHPHSFIVDYTPMGLDALAGYDNNDLKIENKTTLPLTIMATAQGQSVTVTLKGRQLAEGVKIQPTSTLVEYHEAGTPRKEAATPNADLDNTTYYLVESFQDYYKDDVKLESLFISRDLYKVSS